MSDDPEGRNYGPWDKRKRLVPLRTYSGRVVYDRPRHYWSPRDLARVQRYVLASVNNASHTPAWYRALIQWMTDVQQSMISTILSAVGAGNVDASVVQEWLVSLVSQGLKALGADPAKIDQALIDLIGG